MGQRVDRAEIISGITVYSDDQIDYVFYALPNQPRYSLDPVTGKPIFRFVKYRMPVDRPDGEIREIARDHLRPLLRTCGVPDRLVGK